MRSFDGKVLSLDADGGRKRKLEKISLKVQEKTSTKGLEKGQKEDKDGDETFMTNLEIVEKINRNLIKVREVI